MIVTLCGSARFERSFKAWNLALTVAGHAVFTLTAFPSDHGGNKEWYTEEEKTAMDAAYRTKIRTSDAVVVLNVGGYIGESALSEIRYANSIGRRVLFLESWGEGMGRNGVKSPISTVSFRSPWELLGPAGPTRSRSVDRVEKAKVDDLGAPVPSSQFPVPSSPPAYKTIPELLEPLSTRGLLDEVGRRWLDKGDSWRGKVSDTPEYLEIQVAAEGLQGVVDRFCSRPDDGHAFDAVCRRVVQAAVVTSILFDRGRREPETISVVGNGNGSGTGNGS